MTIHQQVQVGPSELETPDLGAGRGLRALTQTGDSWAPAVARIALGAVMLPHGAQKAFGWFGGGGLSATLGWFSQAMHVPAPLALLVVAAELIGAIALIAGLFTRFAAAGIGLVMLGAIAMVHAQHGFFMNWFGTQAGEGFEYHLLALGMAAALAIAGGGRGSLDRLIGAKAR
jgi:putative oxidoreductase